MSREKEIQVGAVFILALAILVSGVLWFKEFTVGESYQEIMVHFQNTSGLQKGDPVEVRGVSSGQVKHISFDQASAQVTLQLDHEIHLARGTRVVIENVGIMGQKMVAVYPGEFSQEELPTGIDFIGEYQVGMGGLMGDSALALQAVNRLASRLEEFLNAMESGEQKGTFTRILKNLDALSTHMANFMGDSKGSLKESLDSFNQAMQAVHQTLDNNGQQITKALSTSNEMMAQADSTMAALETTLARMDQLLTNLESGEGSAGKMLRDEAMYDEMKATIEETRLLIGEIRDNPRKFFKFSVF